VSGSLRVVVDTSSLVRAALDRASAAARLLAMLRDRGSLIASLATLEEVAAVLARPKFARRLPDADRRAFLEALAAAAEVVEPRELVAECRDPGDDKFLDVALAGGADAIVSDDRDLLGLDPWRGVRLVKPEALLAALLDQG
jgi:putative PIN family toxin of toxin-antitoxin system